MGHIRHRSLFILTCFSRIATHTSRTRRSTITLITISHALVIGDMICDACGGLTLYFPWRQLVQLNEMRLRCRRGRWFCMITVRAVPRSRLLLLLNIVKLWRRYDLVAQERNYDARYTRSRCHRPRNGYIEGGSMEAM